MSDSQQLVTVRTLSIVGAEIMCGRATLVWEVMKLSDFIAKNHQGEVCVYIASSIFLSLIFFLFVPAFRAQAELATTPRKDPQQGMGSHAI